MIEAIVLMAIAVGIGAAAAMAFLHFFPEGDDE